jgi:hypothetical protein
MSLFFMWINPIAGFHLHKRTLKRQEFHHKMKRIFRYTLVIIIAGIFTNISTASTIIDWMLVGIMHFIVCFFLWAGLFQKINFISLMSLLSMFLIYGLGYFAGILFFPIITQYEQSKTVRLNNTIVYKEFPIGIPSEICTGNKVCLYKRYSVFPLFERKIFEKDYTDHIKKNKAFHYYESERGKYSYKDYAGMEKCEFNVEYNDTYREIILWKDQIRDTIYFNKIGI